MTAVWSPGSRWLDQIAVLGCPLKFHVLRSSIHLELELIDNLIILPLEKSSWAMPLRTRPCGILWAMLNGGKSRPWKADWYTCGMGKIRSKSLMISLALHIWMRTVETTIALTWRDDEARITLVVILMKG